MRKSIICFKVGTEVARFIFLSAAEVQRQVDGQAQSHEQLLKIDNKKELLFQGRIRNG
jgi:hypothetical protein